MSAQVTREALAHIMINSIATAEGKDANALDRDYALGLIREVLAAIDNNKVESAGTSPIKVSAAALSRPREGTYG